MPDSRASLGPRPKDHKGKMRLRVDRARSRRGRRQIVAQDYKDLRIHRNALRGPPCQLWLTAVIIGHQLKPPSADAASVIDLAHS